MGRDTKISWSSHTFNPFWGCTKISAGCQNCYAETLAARFGVPWGPKVPRHMMSDARWRDVVSWNKRSAIKAVPDRVFCGSMCDFAEARPDLVAPRKRLWELVEATTALRWLMLTKRPGNVPGLVPWQEGNWPKHVALGTTVEDQAAANTRITALKRAGAPLLFLSVEPLLGPIDFGRQLEGVAWVIVGCESGHRARPMELDWARRVRDQAKAAGASFFLKQLVQDGSLEREHPLLDGVAWAEVPDELRRHV